jgi:hypothetical protein
VPWYVGFVFGASWLFFKLLAATIGTRVSAEEELDGLDVPGMGGHGYPEVQGPSTVVRRLPAGGAAFNQVGPAAALAAERGR